MLISAIDPGEKESAFVDFDSERGCIYSDFLPNENIVSLLGGAREERGRDRFLVIEWITGYGLTVGQSIFETCRWVGIFQQAYGIEKTRLLPRREVKEILCGNVSAKDCHVREALIDRIGPVGTKKNPGPMHGITKHKISALAVAVAWSMKNGK